MVLLPRTVHLVPGMMLSVWTLDKEGTLEETVFLDLTPSRYYCTLHPSSRPSTIRVPFKILHHRTCGFDCSSLTTTVAFSENWLPL